MKNFKAGLAAVACLAAGFPLLSVPPATAPGPAFPLAPAQAIPYEGRVIPPGLKDGPFYFFTTDGGRLLAVDAGRGQIAWEFRASFPISRPVGLGREAVYIADDQNIVYCLDRSGRVWWSRGFGQKIAGPLFETEGRLYVGTEQGSLFCLQADTGLDVWRFKTKAALRTGGLLWRDRNGRPFILCGGDEGKLFFLDESGQLRADLDCGGKLSLPLRLEEWRGYVGTENGVFLCLDLQRRRIKWRVQLTGSPVAPALADQKRVYFLTAQGILMSLNKRSGEILWWRTLSSRSAYDLELAGSQVLATSISPDLVSFEAGDGREKGRFRADRELRSNPVWLKGYVLVHDYNPQDEKGALIFLKKKETDDEQK